MQTSVGIRAFLHQTSIRLRLGCDSSVVPTKLGIRICPCRDQQSAVHICALGKLTQSERSAPEVFRLTIGYIAYRRAVAQIARNGSRNVGMALQASNALRDEGLCQKRKGG